MTESRTYWTDEDSALLREHAESLFLSELAELVGRTPNATRLQLKKLEIPHRKRKPPGRARSVWTEERLEWLRIELQTKPVSQVSAESGISTKSIQGAVDDYKILRMSRAEANRSEWRRQRIAATSQAKIAEQYPPEGPWGCFQCKETKPLSEFPSYTNDGHVCYLCLHLSRVERKYGISREQYLSMLEAQGGTCAICKSPEWKEHPKTGRLYMLSVGHDHTCCPGKKSCGKCVRGLLCSRCNNMLGHVESEGVLDGLVDYVAQHRT